MDTQILGLLFVHARSLDLNAWLYLVLWSAGINYYSDNIEVAKINYNEILMVSKREISVVPQKWRI